MTDSIKIASKNCPLVDGEVLLDRYEIKSLQGKGRYGLVYQAQDMSTGQLIALKVLDSFITENSEMMSSFKAKLDSVKKLEHTNIIKLQDYYHHNGLHFITMDWIEGDSLENIMASHTLSDGQVLDIVQQLLEGLHYAQNSTAKHLDIKPENIMLDVTGHLYVADFGLSVLNKDMTSSKDSGSPFYAPPEYLEDASVNQTTDLYAAGVLFFQLFNKKLPYPAKTKAQSIHEKQANKPRFEANRSQFAKLKRWTLSLIDAEVSNRPDTVSIAIEQYYSDLSTSTPRSLSKIVLYIAAFIAITSAFILLRN
ncbi:serine/threonine-protein kinase [Psychrosphaera haliotis]|uniref:non-specific serine/threonine protein kinase n=1 Tax=Psychrosphaera haliotis TaxID=555083 RepID=A0A6N8F8Y2_9GAMM|nr:serine/threonine-protein kinase [Psychrosphaera haliotis]MUH72996.1 protein kinase [Psychrosphaera haliotis]